MASMNRVTLFGALGRDPETKSFQNGGRVCNLRLATSEAWKDKSTGERKERTEWHSVVISSDHLIELAENALRKGSRVFLEGRIQTRKWQDQSGQDRYATEIVVGGYDGRLILIDKREEGQGDYRGNRGSGQSQAESYGGGFGDDLDDGVPF